MDTKQVGDFVNASYPFPKGYEYLRPVVFKAGRSAAGATEDFSAPMVPQGFYGIMEYFFAFSAHAGIAPVYLLDSPVISTQLDFSTVLDTSPGIATGIVYASVNAKGAILIPGMQPTVRFTGLTANDAIACRIQYGLLARIDSELDEKSGTSIPESILEDIYAVPVTEDI